MIFRNGALSAGKGLVAGESKPSKPRMQRFMADLIRGRFCVAGGENAENDGD
jgi:hypothetical protein